MKRVAILVSAAVGAALVVSGAVPAIASSATPATVREIDVDITDLNPCTSEYMRITGQFISIHAPWHTSFAFQGVTAVGLTTGTVYHIARDEFSNGRAVGDDGYPFTVTSGGTLLYVSEGATDNFIDHVTVHVTYNANGDLVAYTIQQTLECVGSDLTI